MTVFLNRAVLAGLAAAVLLVPSGPPAGAAAGNGSVTVADDGVFNTLTTVGYGDTVQWLFQSPTGNLHGTTSDDGFWDSGPQPNEALYTFKFVGAGVYKWHDPVRADLKGKIAVYSKVTCRFVQGVDRGCSVRWGGKGPKYDVEVKHRGGGWKKVFKGTKKTKAHFAPSKNGNYKLRVRTTVGGSTSDWWLATLS